jgi:hypothetical protein
MNKEFFDITDVEVHEIQDKEYGHTNILSRTPELDWTTAIIVSPLLSGKDEFWKSVS